MGTLLRLAAIGGVTIAATVAVAAPSAASSSSTTQAPELIVTMEVNYSPAPGTASINAPSCTLYASIYRLVGTFDIYGIGSTNCSSTVASIEHSVYVDRSRWYGWENMAKWENHVDFNVVKMITDVRYNCWRTGIHDFRVRAYGKVIPYGESPIYAETGGRINEVNCD